MTAFCLIREGPVYRRDAFHAGLKACGYEVRTSAPATFARDDVLITWSRYSDNHAHALRAEAAGAQVWIAENAFIAPGGESPHDQNPRQWYTVARGYHNDDAAIPEAGGERWDALGVTLQPWRDDGEHVLVCPNRSFGAPGRMMPSDWANDVARRLAKLTKRPIRVRPHPGNDPPRKPLAEDLAGAWCAVIWSSSAGVHALVAGAPVICEAPFWICKNAAFANVGSVEEQFEYMNQESRDFPRLASMHRLAWAQWHLDEIASGEPFRRLLDRG